MDLLPSTVVDRYAVERPLGRGALATVYLARHTQLQSWHALKVLDVPSPSVRVRLMREGQVQGTLRHPNIVGVTDVVEVHGAPVLVLEYVDGPALDVLLKVRRPTPDQADHIARGVLQGVAAAHRVGLVHRDVKPGNVLLAIEGRALVPKVADFGLAKLLERPGSPTETRAGATLGTPAYMAPEQIRDAARVDARADVWSLGVLLYELVAGRRPFVGDDTLALFQAVCEGAWPELDDEVPARFRSAIAAALQVSPDARPADAAALHALWADGTDLTAGAWPEDELAAVWALGPREAPSLSSSTGSDTAVPPPDWHAADTFALTYPPVAEPPGLALSPWVASTVGTVLALAFLGAGLPALFPGALGVAGVAGWVIVALSALGVGVAAGLAASVQRGASPQVWWWFVLPAVTHVAAAVLAESDAHETGLVRGMVLQQVGHGLVAVQLLTIAAIHAAAMGIPRSLTPSQLATVGVGVGGGFAAWALSSVSGHGDGYPFLVLLVTAGAAIDTALSLGPAPGPVTVERARAAVWIGGLLATASAAKAAYFTSLIALAGPLRDGDLVAGLEATAALAAQCGASAETLALLGWMVVAALVVLVPLAAGVRPRLARGELVGPAMLLAVALVTGAVGMARRPARIHEAQDRVAVELLRWSLGVEVDPIDDGVRLRAPIGQLRAGDLLSFLTDAAVGGGRVTGATVEELARSLVPCLCGYEARGQCAGLAPTTTCWAAGSQVRAHASDRSTVIELTGP